MDPESPAQQTSSRSAAAPGAATRAAAGRAGRKPVLMVAAESIAAASGMSATVADVLRGRALRHYGEALSQYMAIRLESRELARQGLARMETHMAKWPREALTAEPGVRARLFRLAREITAQLGHEASQKPRALSWQPPPASAGAAYADALSRMRSELDRDKAELLELRYARELSPGELAFVVDAPLEAVITSLHEAAAEAQAYLGDTPPSQLGGLRGALQEAFALAPAPGERGKRSRSGRAALPAGTVIGDRYEIECRVGEGSFGDVYRALDTDVPGHVVALKLLHHISASAEARKSALRELRLIASVFHPSVVDFKDHGWFEQRLWFVMPWYEGETLEERIRRAPLTRAEAQDIFVPLAQALATMHESGIRHQDIKPDNIFLARIGEAGRDETRILPVLIDLGVAAKEAEMIVAGTPLYFAPEIAAQYASKPARPITNKADVFSLALSLRNALEPSTQEQVPGTAVEAFIAYRADHPPEPPEDRSLDFLSPCFERWLSLDAAERPSAEDMARELRALTAPEQRRARRKAVARWMAPLAVGSAVALGSVTYVYLQEREESHRARTLAEHTQEDLDQENARRRRLEAGHAALQQSYENTLLSRDELKQQLDQREQRNRRLSGMLAAARKQQRDLETQLTGARQDIEQREAELTSKRRQLDAQRASIAGLEDQLRDAQEREGFLNARLKDTRQRLTQAENDLNASRGRARDLLNDLDTARADALAEQERASQLERALIGAQQARSDAQRELAEVRQRVADLTRALDKARSGPPGANDPTQPPSPDGAPGL